jgi:hypothetical protein
MDKHLAQHRTQEQGSRIATAAHLNYEFATIRQLGSSFGCHGPETPEQEYGG